MQKSWHMTGIWVLIWQYLARGFKWITTWQGSDGFQKSLHHCALDESSLSIKWVKYGTSPHDFGSSPDIPHILHGQVIAYWSLTMFLRGNFCRKYRSCPLDFGSWPEIAYILHRQVIAYTKWCKNAETWLAYGYSSDSTPQELLNEYQHKGKGIRFIVLYPPKCSHDLPPLAGTVHTETNSIPRGIFQSNWQHIAHTL